MPRTTVAFKLHRLARAEPLVYRRTCGHKKRAWRHVALAFARLRRVSVCLLVLFFVILSCLAILAPSSSNLMLPNIYSVHLLATDLLTQLSGLNYPMIHMMPNWKVSAKLLMAST